MFSYFWGFYCNSSSSLNSSCIISNANYRVLNIPCNSCTNKIISKHSVVNIVRNIVNIVNIQQYLRSRLNRGLVINYELCFKTLEKWDVQKCCSIRIVCYTLNKYIINLLAISKHRFRYIN